MIRSDIALGAGAAVLLFWVVGAHNRLVRLRGAITAAFAPVDAEFAARQALLLQLAERAGSEAAPALPEALRAACAQAAAAHARVRSHPSSATVMSSFRLAEDILADTRARLLAEAAASSTALSVVPAAAAPAGPSDADSAAGTVPDAAGADPAQALAALQLQLTATDATLAFARRQFNAAVNEYNVAVRQFPTWLVASLFHFRAAGAM